MSYKIKGHPPPLAPSPSRAVIILSDCVLRRQIQDETECKGIAGRRRRIFFGGRLEVFLSLARRESGYKLYACKGLLNHTQYIAIGRLGWYIPV